MVTFFTNKVILEILEKYKPIWSLDHSLAVLGWDSETYMPEEGVEERSISVSQLTLLKQKLLTDPSFISLVDKASDERDLNDYEKGVIRVLMRSIKVYRQLPPKLVEELTKTSEEAKVVWRRSRLENNFQTFQPYLEKIVSLLREAADYLGYKAHPYDALLDLYEEDLTSRDVDKVFDIITPVTKNVLSKILDEKLFSQSHPLEKVSYDVEAMKKVNKIVIEKFGYDPKRFRMDISTHPFTIGLGIRDVRITTRYEGKDFKTSLFSTIHEYGHALYELQNNEAFISTPLASGISLGIHESQSRFWENVIGRSKSFCKVVYPMLKDNLSLVPQYSWEDIYYYFNTVKPSLIRVDSDEVTYNFHILLRYRLEKGLISGEINVSDLPDLWCSAMNEYLGMRPKTHSEGVLQDIHWSQASFGYFPTYTLGNIISAQIRHYVIKELPDFNEHILNMNFTPVKVWLREKVHRWGSTYNPKMLLEKMFGEELNPEHFTTYLREKYLK
ncbi:MAG: carboxypeptidase M32 [Nitrososphaeria archaeon]